MGAARGKTSGPFAVKDHQRLVADTTEGAEEGHLKRAVGARDLTSLGIGAVIGTGIFVIIGEGIGIAGPAVIFSFALAALTCVFSALCYAELVVDPGLGQRLHLRLRDAWRAGGVDHRLGPDPRGGPVKRVLLGGVARRLIRRAACPLIVVTRGAE